MRSVSGALRRYTRAMPARDDFSRPKASLAGQWSLSMDGRDAADPDRLRSVFAGRQPAGLARYVAGVRFDQRYLTGTTVPSLEHPQVQRSSGIWVPVNAKVRPAPIDLAKVTIPGSEIFGEIISLESIGDWLHTVDRVELLRNCAGLMALRESPSTDTELLDELLAKRWFMPGPQEAVLARVRAGRALIAPQGVMVLAKLAIQAAASEGGDPPLEWVTVLLGLMDHLGRLDSPSEPESDRPSPGGSLFRFLLSNQSFHHQVDPGLVLAQGRLRWWELADRVPRSRGWMDPRAAFHDATGVDFGDLHAFGLGLWARAIQRPGEPIPLTWFQGFAWPPERFETVLGLISCDLDTLAEHLGRDSDGQAYEWDFDPLRRFPVARLDPELFLVLSPRLLIERVHGLLPFFDVVDGLVAKGQRRKASQFDDLFRAMCALEATDSFRAMATGGPAQRVFVDEDFERAFGKAGKRADVAVDCGAAWVVAEISARRLQRSTVIKGSQAHLDDDLERGVYKKAVQIEATIRDLVEGESRLTGSPPIPGRRFVPVLIATEGFPVNPFLMSRIESDLRARGVLQDSRIGPLRILDQTDLYGLEWMVESGVGSLLDLLDGYAAGGLRAMQFLDWARLERHAEIGRPHRIRPALDKAWRPALDALGTSEDEAA